MKIQPDISSVSTPSVSAGSAAAKAQPSPAAAASKEAGTASVAVTVSSRARALEQAKRSDGAEVNVELVSAVRASIEDGSYVVNPGVIADKLLANAKEMLSRTNS